MINFKNETTALIERNKILSNEKWDAINHAMATSSETCSRLFDEVLLPLSGMEGKLKFATGKVVYDKSLDNIENEIVRECVTEVKDSISALRKVVIDISRELRKESEKPLSIAENA
ncbi:uncharacterized protein METZ01_LOCUS359982 [marine metagenome]|uniref:Uncharacterized protein n=1 Tax=marine metagenome TaxID=408172 RepID=A0A382SD90_9ZZZZ